MKNDVLNFLDDKGRIKSWPSKREMKFEIVKYLASKFEYGRFYSEREVNSIIDNWHTFGDYFMLRRGLIDCWFLSRTRSGSRYWREEQSSLGHITQVVSENYDFEKIVGISQMNNGVSADSYYILSDKGEFIFKDIKQNQMNHPENEDIILNTLREDGLPVPQIYRTKRGSSLICDGDKKYHLQSFIEGRIYERCNAPDWLLYQSAEMLGKIQVSLSKLPDLPIGMGKGFLEYNTTETAVENHTHTLKMARDKGDDEIAEVIEEKIKLIQKHKNLKFDLSQMTCRNTHGDYSINQILCGRDKINGVMDFTSACYHPVCWEVIRSYSLADPRCGDGGFDQDNFKRYIDNYMKYGSLNDYDLKVMPEFYLFQNLVCEYFHQYYNSEFRDRKILYDNAMFTFKQCKALSDIVEKGVRIV